MMNSRIEKVAIVLLVILFLATTGFSYFKYSELRVHNDQLFTLISNLESDLNETNKAYRQLNQSYSNLVNQYNILSQELNRLNEKFVTLSSYASRTGVNQFQITVNLENIGVSDAQIVDIWLNNKTIYIDKTNSVQFIVWYDVVDVLWTDSKNKVIVESGQTISIIINQQSDKTIKLSSGQKISISIISTSGRIFTTNMRIPRFFVEEVPI